MSILSQKTIANKIVFSGVGLHTGNNVQLNLIPAAPNTGIIFKRVDLLKNNIVLPTFENVSDTTLCTTISNNNGVKISTIEHLMGALYGIGIDNLIIEINSQELPILDGSAKVFVEKILSTGIKSSSSPIKLIKINKKVSYSEGSKKISIDQSKVASEIDFEIEYKNKIIQTQRNKINIFNDDLKDIFESRTFCLYEDIENIKKIGLAKGGSLENAIVVDNEKILNKDGLRNDKEFVNHKILDLAGDFMLSGFRVIGQINCYQGGHELTNIFLRKLLNLKSSSSIVEMNNLEISKKIRPLHSISIAASA